VAHRFAFAGALALALAAPTVAISNAAVVVIPTVRFMCIPFAPQLFSMQ
jgi:hypothetical protein